jgi:hypothetical protein
MLTESQIGSTLRIGLREDVIEGNLWHEREISNVVLRLEVSFERRFGHTRDEPIRDSVSSLGVPR